MDWRCWGFLSPKTRERYLQQQDASRKRTMEKFAQDWAAEMKRKSKKPRKVPAALLAPVHIPPGMVADASSDADARLRGFYLAAAGDPFAAELAVYALIELEHRIILLEAYLERNPPNPVSNPERLARFQLEHLEYWEQLAATLGEDRFEALYEAHWERANTAARRALDANNGRGSYCVLPTFNADGSHAQYGERDVPWN